MPYQKGPLTFMSGFTSLVGCCVSSTTSLATPSVCTMVTDIVQELNIRDAKKIPKNRLIYRVTSQAKRQRNRINSSFVHVWFRYWVRCSELIRERPRRITSSIRRWCHRYLYCHISRSPKCPVDMRLPGQFQSDVAHMLACRLQ